MDPKDRKTSTGASRIGLVVLCVLGVLCVDSALVRGQQGGFAMPDPKQMSGIPRPVDDLPKGAISVRLIRGSLSNNIPNHQVELHIGSKVLTQKTDENGRAQFSDLPAGTTVKATADVDGEKLESQEFPAPAAGGIRLMLVATDTSKGPATTPDAPAISGQVVIADQSRIVVEPDDEGVQVFYLLDIANNARAPVNPPAPFAFDLPADAESAQLMEGSSPTASVKGKHVAVEGPFAPGHTYVQVASRMPLGNGELRIQQAFPANLESLAVVVKKVGSTALSSPQVAQQRDIPAEGETFIAGQGGAVAAGTPINLIVSGYPHHSATPRFVALGLAVAIAVVGGFMLGRPDEQPAGRAAERKRLIARREKLFADLVRLEQDHRTRHGDATRYGTRREEILSGLEQVYSSLEAQDAAAPQADRRGMAAPLGALGAP
jgi:hypothetical protein